MGIHLNLSVVLRDWRERYRITGPVLTLGVEDVAFTRAEFDRTFDAAVAFASDQAEPRWTAKELFARLGFDNVAALDVNDLAGADIVFDLNEPQPPVDARQKFGLIINAGTLEHVFHVPNALANLSAMLKPGGFILHVLPCNNWVDHGFYQFSPTLMFDYYTAVAYEVLESAMVIFNPRRQGGRCWEVRPAPVGIYGSGRSGQLDDRAYLHTILVRRGTEGRERAIPVQSLYARRPARPLGGPRWFSPYELISGRRIDHPNRGIVPLKGLRHDKGLAWTVGVPEFKHLADSSDDPVRSLLVVLEDKTALGPAHAPRVSIRKQGGGAYSHWGDYLYISTTDDSDPNSNGRQYVAILPYGSTG
jgi:hypothetical protein